MPRDSIRTLVMSAEKDAVKRFISHMHQSWDQLQVETGQVCSYSKKNDAECTSVILHFKVNFSDGQEMTCFIF